ncbi:MAG: DnaA/Hda family protein, partial [Anaerolineales bacterium]
TLHGQDKQIVISSDRAPRALVTLEERLRSRFEWGLTADVQPPDLETRLAILRSKAERAHRSLPGDILELIARRVHSNIRELEGALTRVIALSDLSGAPLTHELAERALVDLVPNPASLTSDRILDAVAAQFNVSMDRLRGRERSQEVVLPRQIAMYLLRHETGASLPQIGQTLGGRDHTTVMYGVDRIADRLKADETLRRQVLTLRETLYGEKRLVA